MLSTYTNTFFPICSFVISLFLFCMFYLKKNTENMETKVYQRLINGGLIESSLYVGIIITADLFYHPNLLTLYEILNKLLSCTYVIWMALMFYYIFSISSDSFEKLKSKVLNILKIVNAIFILLILIVPIDIYFDPIKYNSNSSGMAINILSFACCFYLGAMIVLIFIHRKNPGLNSKFVPCYILFILLTVSLIIRYFDPFFNVTSNVLSFVLLIMYSTIENPDVRMIEQLNIAREQADKANAAKTDFLSSMSHEIRTPLNAIVGFSQNLYEDNIPDSAKEQVEDIISASNSLLEIVNGILDISKIEANKLEIINDEYSFKKVFDELVILTRARMGEKTLDFRVVYDESIPPVFFGDKTRIKQVILNLLTNSVKYTKTGFIEFKVSSVIKDDVCRLIISVEDSGVGIKQENIDKLFTKFQRFEERNTTIEGTGLGLAITKKLVELMGGQIIVHSVYGEGSKFTIVINQRIVKNPVKNIEEMHSLAVNSEVFDLSGKKVLVVDDNKLNLKVASKLLEKYSLDIETVVSGFECLDKIKAGNKYDLVLLDDMMPKMSGVETLKELKKIEGFTTPVVILTANAISGMKEKYLNDGFNDYLAKPIDKAELNRVLKAFLK